MALYDADQLAVHVCRNKVDIDDLFRAARPINYRVDTYLQRLRFAWGVLIGKYDAVRWYKQ